MKKFNKILLVATALTAVSTSAVLADDNIVFIAQDGTTNTANFLQNNSTTPASTNEFGATGNVARQDGLSNEIDSDQIGLNNDIGISGAGFDQNGHDNEAVLLQSSDDNHINVVQQYNNGVGTTGINELDINQNNASGNAVGSSGNTVRLVSQSATAGGTNDADIVQDGHGNEIFNITQINDGVTGEDNDIDAIITGNGNGNIGLNPGSNAATVNSNNSELYQDGHTNLIELYITGAGNQFAVRQTGDNNAVNQDFTVTGNSNQLGVHQNNDNNVIDITNIEGNSNDIGIKQDGADYANIALNTTGTPGSSATSNSNLILIVQSGNNSGVRAAGGSVAFPSAAGTAGTWVALDGDSNDVTVYQNGDTGEARVTVVGASNLLNIRQDGNAEHVNVNIAGSFNNLGGVFSGAAAAYNGSLAAGDIFQAGGSNSVTMLVGTTTASDNNLFAFNQTNGGNVISGEVISGSGNQAVVIQDGGDNYSFFQQTGTNNNIGISQ